MNKQQPYLKQLMMAALLTTGLVATDSSHAAQNVTVTFNAVLLPGTCNVSVDSLGPDATVILRKVTTDELNYTGTAGTTAFKIDFTDCYATLSTARAFFESGTTTNSRGYVSNTGGTARNVDFILSADSSAATQIVPGDSNQQGDFVDITSGSASQTYYISYRTDGQNATAGTVNGSITYRLDYK